MRLSRSFSSWFGEIRFALWSAPLLAEGESIVPWTLVAPEITRWLADPIECQALLVVRAQVQRTFGAFDLDDVRDDLVEALRSRQLLAVVRRLERRVHQRVEPQKKPVEPGEAEPRTEMLRWFEVRLVDEVGEPIPDVAVTFSLDSGVQRTQTNGAGIARIEDKGRSATVRLDDEGPLRRVLRERWSAPRGKQWVVPDGDESRFDVVQVRRTVKFPSTTIFAAGPHTIVFQPRIVQADLKGLWFATSKCFLLPPARHTLQRVATLYEQNPETDILIVGHTDRAGTPQQNDPLSVERAEAVAAYLKDEVDVWLAWYGAGKPAERRWGADEDRAMIQALAEEAGEVIPANEGDVRWYQRTRGLTVDGAAGPITRRAVIDEYMGLDGTTLPEDILPVCHGCGENFPQKPTADGAAAPENRRVEVFFFDNPIAPQERPAAVLPPPPGKNSSAGAKEYPEWLLRVRERHEFVAGQWIRVLMRYEDGTPAQDVGFKIRYSNGTELLANTSQQGILSVHLAEELTWSILNVRDDSIVTAFV